MDKDAIYSRVEKRLFELPIEDGSSVTHLRSSQGYFFNLILPGGIRMTVTQYEGEFEQGAYVNVELDEDVVIQDYMSIDDIVSSMLTYYNGTN